MKLLELLKQLFGQSYLNKIIGTRTNISKPIKMDRNSPYKLYSDKAFEYAKPIMFALGLLITSHNTGPILFALFFSKL